MHVCIYLHKMITTLQSMNLAKKIVQNFMYKSGLVRSVLELSTKRELKVLYKIHTRWIGQTLKNVLTDPSHMASLC